ncbi:hypothetical protein LSH36_1291g00034 [Paralvinella palmiformis]|uniref:Uncharacterized protein n=1 Tax=Paralvinella palmiformis TaxID=53620 RepID=A0AAD9MPI1_9ANNE|nr:hypothetical protein LSH36_1291g00034 [Paralvinella palmiformis]
MAPLTHMSSSDCDIAADRKYDDPSADQATIHDADVALESANMNTSFDSRIGVEWSREVVPARDGKTGNSVRSRRREFGKLVRLRDPRNDSDWFSANGLR